MFMYQILMNLYLISSITYFAPPCRILGSKIALLIVADHALVRLKR